MVLKSNEMKDRNAVKQHNDMSIVLKSNEMEDRNADTGDFTFT